MSDTPRTDGREFDFEGLEGDRFVESDFARELERENAIFRQAFEAAKAFIDSHVADPDITDKMCERYAEYQSALRMVQAITPPPPKK